MDMRNFAAKQEPADVSRPLEPGCSLGSYLILEQLASGRHANVYLAHDVALDRAVVLKTAPAEAGPSEIAALRHEARALARARNPYLVTAHALHDGGPLPTLVLEHLVGETLAERLHRRGPLPVSLAGELFTKLLTGLEEMHRAGIVHGGIKTDNIFLTTDGSPKFLGLQFAVFRDRPAMVPAVRAPDLLYGAPEHRSASAADPRADLFSLGLCLQEALTGALPFETKNRAGQRRPSPPPALLAVLTRATSEDPELRFTSAMSFREALIAAIADARAGRKRAAMPRTRRLLRTLAFDAALVAVLVGLVFGLGLYPETDPAEQATTTGGAAAGGSRPAQQAGNPAGDDEHDKYNALRRAWGG